MSLRGRRAASVSIAAVSVAVLVSVGLAGMGAQRVGHVSADTTSTGFMGAGGDLPVTQAVASLEARCRRAMIDGTCRAMASSASSAPAADGPSDAAPGTRVFIAGTGEVDATAYEALSRFGDQMCEEAARACDQDWNGTECRIARALYPPAS